MLLATGATVLARYFLPLDMHWGSLWLGLFCAISLAAQVVEAKQLARLVEWLRTPDAPLPTRLSAQWMELASYVIRQRRKHKDRLAHSDKRLQDFLAAMQASPNGVVLLDADDRIEWFNQTAAEHFDFDPRRDAQQHFTNLVRDPDHRGLLCRPRFSAQCVDCGEVSRTLVGATHLGAAARVRTESEPAVVARRHRH